MTRLEDLKPDAQVSGLVGRETVRIVSSHTMGEAPSRPSLGKWATAAQAACCGE